jgi:hypothetical protein
MKIFLFFSIMLLSCHLTFAKKKADSTIVQIDHGFENPEMIDLGRSLNLEYFKVSFNDSLLHDRVFKFVMREYRNGKLVLEEDFLAGETPRSFYQYDDKQGFNLRLLTRTVSKEDLQLHFFFPGFSRVKRFESVKDKSNQYSLRDNNARGGKVRVPIGKPFPFFTYSLPYEDPKKPGWLQYCALTNDGIPPEKWGEKYGVQHYIVIELTIQ